MRHLAIFNTHATVVTIDGDIDATDKDGNVVTLDEALITAEITRLQAVYNAQEYSRNRKIEYDKLNQDEMRYDDVKNSTTTWVDAIDAIKAKYPKGK
jgi:hypothetical protein|tara:strand:+ start:688 stop:978 length:291 start_codon:yes stop_codon:yes gene_type:complete